MIRPGFRWDAAGCYLFDIDGTLLNSRDAVHYHAFRQAIRELFGLDAGIDGVPVHGNTDPGILRAVLRRAGIEEKDITASLPKIVERMCSEVSRHQSELAPELCPAIPELLIYLRERGKLLVAASGNLEPIGWAKLEKAGIRTMFALGAFSWPREARADIFRDAVDQARQQLGEDTTVFAVGDTPSDIEAARAIGIPVIALATGIYSFDQLLACSPDACLDCAGDLFAFDAGEAKSAIRQE